MEVLKHPTDKIFANYAETALNILHSIFQCNFVKFLLDEFIATYALDLSHCVIWRKKCSVWKPWFVSSGKKETSLSIIEWMKIFQVEADKVFRII